MSINYDLWPNPDGQLGKNKIEIPDGVTVTWPEGDALIGNFIYKDGLLSGFVDYKALVANESKTSTIPYDYFHISLSKELEGIISFTSGENCKHLDVSYFESANSGDTIMFKYKGCKSYDDISSVDPDYLTNDIVDGVWSESLTDLSSGESMFNNCTNLITFEGDLSNLINGLLMFRRCFGLSSFTSDLSNLINGRLMFTTCYNFTSFESDLSSLISGQSMFDMSKFDAKSVKCIADTIKDINAEKKLYQDGTIPYVTFESIGYEYSSPQGFMSDGSYVFTYDDPNPSTFEISETEVGNLTLGIDVINDAATIEQQLEDFARAVTFDSWTDLKQHFINKGWTVTFIYGGTSANITYGLKDREQIIPCPIFAKLIEADKDSAEYCTEDASSFYNIDWGHDVTDTSSYTQFNSLEDAMTYWNVIPKENIITTEE